ncbi:MAG: nucleotide exchange factor GrpE [Spirochaetota bacterium]
MSRGKEKVDALPEDTGVKKGIEPDETGEVEETPKIEEISEVIKEKQAGEQDETEIQAGVVAEALPEEDPIIRLEKKVQELEQENSLLKDQYLRKQADYENFRKRMFREREEAVRYANSNLLLDLISIIDDFERAIKSSEDSLDFTSFHSGIELIEKQFTSMLERNWGLRRFESVGELFDPEKHAAVNMEGSDKYDTDTVIEEYQKGYLLHDRVLRPAKVKVAMPAQKVEGASEQSAEEKQETNLGEK